MTDVLHHIPDVRLFFYEASRCLLPGGKIIMVEPWGSAWGKYIYTHLHHEPFDLSVKSWRFPFQGPLSSANDALPTIIFKRDICLFMEEFPQFEIEVIKPGYPFRYLVSGGVSMRQLMPDWTIGIWKTIESIFTPYMDTWGMFAIISIKKAVNW